MKLKVIIPNAGMADETLRAREKMLSAFAKPDTQISVDCIAGGPESIESVYDEVLTGPYILDKAIQAEKDGFDAVIIYCGSDPAIDAVREVLDIPVIGPGFATTSIAMDLGHAFSVITVLESSKERSKEQVRHRGFDITRLASIRSIGVPVSDLGKDREADYRALEAAAKKCIEDGAHSIFLSCLGMAGMGERLTKALGIPVLDPAPISIRYAEMIVGLGVSQSRLAYPNPPEKKIY